MHISWKVKKHFITEQSKSFKYYVENVKNVLQLKGCISESYYMHYYNHNYIKIN